MQNLLHQGYAASSLVGDDAFSNENPQLFNLSEMCASRRTRGIFYDYRDWQNLIANKGAQSDRYVSVGAYREKPSYGSQSFMLPYIVLDVDGESVFESFESSRRILRNMQYAGIPMDSISVSFTGGRGFHIRIPSGLIGNPVFASKKAATRTLRVFTKTVADAPVDEALFRPSQLVRLVGSRNPATGFFCTKFSAPDFSGSTLVKLITMSKTFTPSFCDDPRLIPYNDRAVELFREASENSIHAMIFDMDEIPDKHDGESSGIVERAMLGVGKSDAWWPGVCGRNFAAFVIAKHYSALGGEEMARHMVEKANALNDPPLSRREINDTIRSAARKFARTR